MAIFGCTIKVCRYHDWRKDRTTVLRGVLGGIEAGVFENATSLFQFLSFSLFSGLRRVIVECLSHISSRPAISRPSQSGDFLRAIHAHVHIARWYSQTVVFVHVV